MKYIFKNAIDNSTSMAAIILIILCLSLPVYQWANLPEITILKILAGLAALALGICKITFIPLAVEKYNAQSRLLAACLLLIALASLFFSVCASRDLLNTITSYNQHKVTVNSLTYRNAMTELNALNAEIDSLTTLLTLDQQHGYRERAYTQRENLSNLKEERREAARRVEKLAETSNNRDTATFGKHITTSIAGNHLTLEPATGVAIMLHITCIFSVLAVTSKTPKKNTIQQKNTEKKQTRKTLSDQANDLAPSQLKLAERITAGEFGNEPVLREIIAVKAIKGGFKKVRPVFDHLISTKQLSESGKGFELVQKTIHS